MTSEESWDKIWRTLDEAAALQRLNNEKIARMVARRDRAAQIPGGPIEGTNALAERMNILTERTIQAMDAMSRLANLAANHGNPVQFSAGVFSA